MILYNGRAISWVQYMDRKPIKHGIKVFVLCCASTGVVVSFLVYTGADDATPGEARTNIGVCDTFLENGVGGVRYTDNFYTCINLMEHCYFPEVVKNCTGFPLSHAVEYRTSPGGTGVDSASYSAIGSQKNLFQDHKQVAFLHNYVVEPIGGCFVSRYC